VEAKDRANVTDRVYHYTVGIYLQSIIESGEIFPATAHVPRGERPAVWFSINPEWEETANKLVVRKVKGRVVPMKGTRETTAALGAGLVRIAVRPEAAPFSWQDYRMLSGVAKAHADALENAARFDGANPAEWRVSFGSVPRSEWVDVEVWTEAGWVSAMK
jgi:hypothetical protein